MRGARVRAFWHGLVSPGRIRSQAALVLFALAATWNCSSATEIVNPPDPLKPVSVKKDKEEADPDIALALRMERAFQKVAAKVRPSAVSVSVVARGGSWREEFQRLQEQGGGGLDRHSAGSGVVIDTSGKILTNEHVVRGADEIKVTLSDGTVFAAEIAGADPRSDLAVLRPIKPLDRELVPVELADSDDV